MPIWRCHRFEKLTKSRHISLSLKWCLTAVFGQRVTMWNACQCDDDLKWQNWYILSLHYSSLPDTLTAFCSLSLHFIPTPISTSTSSTSTSSTAIKMQEMCETVLHLFILNFCCKIFDLLRASFLSFCMRIAVLRSHHIQLALSRKMGLPRFQIHYFHKKSSS